MAPDLSELAGRIAVCMTASELRALASRLGASDVSTRQGSAREVARDLLRWFEREGRLGELLAALREARPLMEWPNADDSAPSGPAMTGEAQVAAPTGDGQGATVGSAAPLPPREPLEPPGSPRDASSPGRVPPGWPATVTPDAAPPPTPSAAPWILVAALLAVGAVAAAFIVGKASATAPASPASVAPRGDSTPLRRVDGPSVRASDAFARGLAHVATICELRDGSTDVLKAASMQCGPPRVRARSVGPTMPEPVLPESATATEPTDPRGSSAPHVARARPVESQGSTGACVAGCDSRYSRCLTQCGPEPQQSTRYTEHQQCLSRCLAASSSCRVACP